jgi:hypothetical protein
MGAGAGAAQIGAAAGAQQAGAGAQQPWPFFMKLNRPASALFVLTQQTIKAAVKVIHFISGSPKFKNVLRT